MSGGLNSIRKRWGVDLTPRSLRPGYESVAAKEYPIKVASPEDDAIGAPTILGGLVSLDPTDYLGPKALANLAAAVKTGLGGLAMVGMIKPGADWVGKKSPTVEKLARNKDKFLYHSSDPKNLDSLHYGIEPTNTGPWVSEVAHGTGVDDVVGLLENSTPLAWFSDTPTWVPAFVSRVTGKPVSQITAEDIAKHGHLAVINRKGADTGNIYKIGKQGLLEGEYSTVENLRGKKMKAYETPMYGETNYGRRMDPFGVEHDEYVSTDTVTPLVQLTGDDLVQFLRLSGFLK
jgi:hypothetical protein